MLVGDLPLQKWYTHIMERIPEPRQLMDEEEQVRAYAQADFSEPHDAFVHACYERYGLADGKVVDLGCGPADISIRFAQKNPRCDIVGMDGSAVMVRHGVQAIQKADLQQRITLQQAYFPLGQEVAQHFSWLISNSLLHHLFDPMVMWQTVSALALPGAVVCIMDLMRPQSLSEVERLVAQYAADEPDVLRRDFYNSLLAAFRPKELRQQLQAAKLDHLHVDVLSDRHLLVHGRF